MDQGHLGAVVDVESGCQLWRGKHRYDRHAVHVVRNRLAIDTEAAPAFALGRLKALEKVEERDRRGCVFRGRVIEARQHCGG